MATGDNLPGIFGNLVQSVMKSGGDPMYMVRFRGARDAKYNLQRCKGVVPPSDIRQKFRVSQALKTWLPQQSWTIIKDDVEEKKCPFNFLFK